MAVWINQTREIAVGDVVYAIQQANKIRTLWDCAETADLETAVIGKITHHRRRWMISSK